MSNAIHISHNCGQNGQYSIRSLASANVMTNAPTHRSAIAICNSFLVSYHFHNGNYLWIYIRKQQQQKINKNNRNPKKNLPNETRKRLPRRLSLLSDAMATQTSMLPNIEINITITNIIPIIIFRYIDNESVDRNVNDDDDDDFSSIDGDDDDDEEIYSSIDVANKVDIVDNDCSSNSIIIYHSSQQSFGKKSSKTKKNKK